MLSWDSLPTPNFQKEVLDREKKTCLWGRRELGTFEEQNEGAWAQRSGQLVESQNRVRIWGQMWGLRGHEVEFEFYFRHNGKSREGSEAHFLLCKSKQKTRNLVRRM